MKFKFFTPDGQLMAEFDNLDDLVNNILRVVEQEDYWDCFYVDIETDLYTYPEAYPSSIIVALWVFHKEYPDNDALTVDMDKYFKPSILWVSPFDAFVDDDTVRDLFSILEEIYVF